MYPCGLDMSTRSFLGNSGQRDAGLWTERAGYSLKAVQTSFNNGSTEMNTTKGFLYVAKICKVAREVYGLQCHNDYKTEIDRMRAIDRVGLSQWNQKFIILASSWVLRLPRRAFRLFQSCSWLHGVQRFCPGVSLERDGTLQTAG